METGSDAVVCLEETVDASGTIDVSSADLSNAAAASVRDDGLKLEQASVVDTVQQTGTVKLTSIILFSIFITIFTGY